MVPRSLAPSVRAGGEPGGAVRSGSDRGVAQTHQQLGQRRVRGVTLRRDRASVGGRRERRPGHADGRIVPGEAELVRAVVLVGDEVDELERLEGEEAVGDAGRDVDPVVGVELAGLDDGRRVAVERGADVDERDERPPVRRPPTGRPGGDGGGARAGRPRPRSTGWPGRRWRPGTTRRATARGTTPRVSPWRAIVP